MEKPQTAPEASEAANATNPNEIDDLLREMGGNWGVDEIVTVIDTPFLAVETDNGLDVGDLYGGAFFLASERVESLPESQLIDAAWPETLDAMVILDAEKFPDLGLNSFDRLLIEDTKATPPQSAKEKFYVQPLRAGSKLTF